MARASVSSTKMYSRFPSPIILLYTKPITIPVCRLRLVGYLLKFGLAVNQAYLCRGTQYGADYGKVKDYTKNLLAQSIPSVTIPLSPTRHLSVSGFQGGAFVISGLPGDADIFTFHISRFTIYYLR